jgi:hypothetical protein
LLADSIWLTKCQLGLADLFRIVAPDHGGALLDVPPKTPEPRRQRRQATTAKVCLDASGLLVPNFLGRSGRRCCQPEGLAAPHETGQLVVYGLPALLLAVSRTGLVRCPAHRQNA